MSERRELKTVRMAAVKTEGDFLVHYAKDGSWNHLDVDDALTLEDARKLASARKSLGFQTKITEKRTGTEIP